MFSKLTMRAIYTLSISVFFLALNSCAEKSVQTLIDDFEEYSANGQITNARKCIDEALLLDSTSIFLYNARGISSLELKEYKTAIEDFNKALKIDSENILALTKRATAKTLKKDYDSALDDYKYAIILKGFKPTSDTIVNYSVGKPELYEDPLLFDIVYLRGKAYYDTYNLFLAFDDFNLCIEASLGASADSKFDKIPECYYWRGHTLKRMGEINRACSDLHIAAESGISQAIGDIESICGEVDLLN